MSTYEGCNWAPLVTARVGDSELIIHFQEAYAKFFSVCYDKQDIQTNWPSEKPNNRGTICMKVFSEVIQSVKGNNCGLIPYISGSV